uniref:Olfactomedin-like domain-containing protein n=1 Tax=Romanomermis culicivorax TaxID=13658 RepID=A0A915IPS8_ROMCU
MFLYCSVEALLKREKLVRTFISRFHSSAESGYPAVFDLETNQTKELTIEGASFTGSSYLYADNPENYFDLEVDENGLWLIFKYKNVEHLSVARLHPKTLQALRVWNLTQLNARTVGNAWITCGILYAIRSSRAQNTNMFVAYDLYRRKYASVDMPWTNPYGNANMVSYNPIDRKIYTYDNGHLMTIPLLLSFDTDHYSIS